MINLYKSTRTLAVLIVTLEIVLLALTTAAFFWLPDSQQVFGIILLSSVALALLFPLFALWKTRGRWGRVWIVTLLAVSALVIYWDHWLPTVFGVFQDNLLAILVLALFLTFFVILTAAWLRRWRISNSVVMNGIIMPYLWIDPSGFLYYWLRRQYHQVWQLLYENQTRIKLVPLRTARRYELVLKQSIQNRCQQLVQQLDQVELEQLLNQQNTWPKVGKQLNILSHHFTALLRHYEPLYRQQEERPSLGERRNLQEILPILLLALLLVKRGNRLASQVQANPTPHTLDFLVQFEKTLSVFIQYLLRVEGKPVPSGSSELAKLLNHFQEHITFNQKLAAHLSTFQIILQVEEIAASSDDTAEIYYIDQHLRTTENLDTPESTALLTRSLEKELWLRMGFAYGRHVRVLRSPDKEPSFAQKAYREAHQCFLEANFTQGLDEFKKNMA